MLKFCNKPKNAANIRNPRILLGVSQHYKFCHNFCSQNLIHCKVKGMGWSKTGVSNISVINQWIFTKFSAVVHYVMSHQIIKFQLICIIYAWISHNSKVPIEERYSEKTNYSKHMFSSVTCSLHSRGCNSYFEIC